MKTGSNCTKIRYGRKCVVVVKYGVMKTIRYGPYVKIGINGDKRAGGKVKVVW